MTWQEELRKLDEDYSSGKLSADDYTKRREQVLYSAVTRGTGEQQTAQSQTAAQPPEDDHASAGQQAGVNPSGTDQAQAGPDAPSDATQVFQAPASSPHGTPQQQGQTPQPDKEASQEATRAVPPPDSSAERTQFVSQGQLQQPPSPPGGFAQPHAQQQPYAPQQPPWNAPDDDSSPPWGGSEFPPVAPSSDADWVRQGPELFQGSGKGNGKSHAGTVLAGALALLVLAGIGIGAFFLLGNGGDEEGPAGTADPEPPAEEPPEEPEKLALPELAGSAEDHSHIEGFGDLPELNYLLDDELEIYEEAGARDVRFNVQHLPSDSTAIVLLVESAGEEDAAEAAEALREIQVGNGAEEVDDQPEGILTTEYGDDDKNQIRAHYASEDVIVRLEVVTTEGASTARDDYEDTLDAALEAMPADA
ncbi:hypothetical protein H0B56_18315 [Haloechinothrix sp. YIM 98757]|uniref:Short C-terminal domain-containing protein n=1 Tax=Haloechinothrix aidingensis TaxID=2752311 RepID=A0A838AE49_9PSEU|nr:hypothetical protein [Haloechinothrix aidingensis]MBA0127503.1 hypothetical protein [Haloechinothrix aidingensis]